MDESNQRGETVVTDFEQFWKELSEWWFVFGFYGKEYGRRYGAELIRGEEEDVTLKEGRREYRLRCRWDRSLLVVGMASPWVGEWDYAQLFRAKGTLQPVGEGFFCKGLRMEVVRLLLREIVSFQKWLSTTPWAVEERDRAIKRELASFDEQIRSIQQAQKDLAEAQMNHEKRRGVMSKSKFSRKSKVLEERGKSLEGELCSVESRRDEYSKPWFARYQWMRRCRDMPEEADLWIGERDGRLQEDRYRKWVVDTMNREWIGDTGNREQRWDSTAPVKLALANAGLK